MICINLVSPTGLYHYGIVYQIMYSHLRLQIHLKHALINFGKIKMCDTIGKLIYYLPEVIVKLS